MSPKKIDRTFPSQIRVFSDKILSKIIAISLRHDFDCGESAIKKIGRKTGANLRAIRNWYEAKNTPSTKHFLALTQVSPTLCQWVLEEVIVPHSETIIDQIFDEKVEPKSEQDSVQKHPSITDIHVGINVGINVPRKNLGVRQEWFLVQLRNGRQSSAQDIATHFRVKIRTAERDIAELKNKGYITYVGSRRSGFHQIVK